MADIAVVLVLKNLKQLMNCKAVSYQISFFEKYQIESFNEELGFLISFLKDSEKKRHEHMEVKDLVTQITDLAYEAEDIIEGLVIYYRPCRHGIFSDVIQKIKSIKEKVMEIYEKTLYGIVPQVGMSSHIRGLSRGIPPTSEEETVVGFDNEAEMIKERLTGVSKQLGVISIVGMAGLGKTTLARKVYNDLFIVHHFYIRGWTYVSQGYQKRDLLLRILSSIVEHKDGICKMSDEKLGEELYRRLKGQRYLIVMDDIEAWNDLKKYFPNDNNGSRIMFTSRITDVALHAKPDSPPHFLRFLTEGESWDLFQQKTFPKENCPPVLKEVGMQIVKKCGGLPLAIVVVAGLLSKTDKIQDWWEQVAQSVSSYIISDTEQCVDALSLSYHHLPTHLKSCFLYFGAIPEDYEIPVWKLIRLWIAEGFIYEIGQQSLEDVAEEYLIDLIDRNLVLVSKKRSTGGIKACRIHDLLRDLCLRKAMEENFLKIIYEHEEVSSIPIVNKQFLCYESSRISVMMQSQEAGLPSSHLSTFSIHKPKKVRPHNHNLSYDLFLRKAEEENLPENSSRPLANKQFSCYILGMRQSRQGAGLPSPPLSSFPIHKAKKQRRLCTHTVMGHLLCSSHCPS